MGRTATELGQVAALALALAVATSCVPAPVREAARAEQVIAGAEPLLRRLDLNVPELDPAELAAIDLVPGRASPGLDGALAPPPFVADARSPDDAARALECLTEAVYHEARSEGEDGQRAVAQVVLNRVRDRAFPSSVCGVVYQGSHRRTGCQFTFTCDGSLARRREPNGWVRAQAVAAAALAGEVYAPVGSATHYHANYVSPWWAPSLHRIGAVGSHVFYRWAGALERALTFRQRYTGTEPGVAVSRPGVAVARGGTPGLEGGVAVHRGGASLHEAGITVHRGGAATTAAAETTEDAAPAARPARLTLSKGVRVHRDAPAAVDADWSGSYTLDDATVGAES